MARRTGRSTSQASAVTRTASVTSRATVLPSALSRRVTLTVLTALAIGSSALGLTSEAMRSQTGPAGSSRLGRLGWAAGAGCSATGVPSDAVSSRRPGAPGLLVR